MVCEDITHFQYCQKIVLLRNSDREILLAKRKNEADYDGVFTFVGGKMETADSDILGGLKREKEEEIGAKVKISICPKFSYNLLYRKKDGNSMLIPHYYASYLSGDIILSSDEYADFAWVPLDKLDEFEPKIANIPKVCSKLLKIKSGIDRSDFVVI